MNKRKSRVFFTAVYLCALSIVVVASDVPDVEAGVDVEAAQDGLPLTTLTRTGNVFAVILAEESGASCKAVEHQTQLVVCQDCGHIHKGLWCGYRPSQVSEAAEGSRIFYMSPNETSRTAAVDSHAVFFPLSPSRRKSLSHLMGAVPVSSVSTLSSSDCSCSAASTATTVTSTPRSSAQSMVSSVTPSVVMPYIVAFDGLTPSEVQRHSEDLQDDDDDWQLGPSPTSRSSGCSAATTVTSTPRSSTQSVESAVTPRISIAHWPAIPRSSGSPGASVTVEEGRSVVRNVQDDFNDGWRFCPSRIGMCAGTFIMVSCLSALGATIWYFVLGAPGSGSTRNKKLDSAKDRAQMVPIKVVHQAAMCASL